MRQVGQQKCGEWKGRIYAMEDEGPNPVPLAGIDISMKVEYGIGSPNLPPRSVTIRHFVLSTWHLPRL
jgi:hypothetical protein